MKQWFLLGLSMIALPALAEMTPCELLKAQQAGEVQLVDVRSQGEFDKGYITGASLIPHTAVAERYSELDADKTVVLYCHSGRRAARAQSILEDKGFKVALLDGHWKGWPSNLKASDCDE